MDALLLDRSPPNTNSFVQDHPISFDDPANFQLEYVPTLSSLGEPSEGFDILDHESHTPLMSNDQSKSQLPEEELIHCKCVLCDTAHTSRSELQRHYEDHEHVCYECCQSFETNQLLEFHAGQECHGAYLCTDCNESFCRRDVLGRHRLKHLPNPKKYSCNHCKKWRAPNGFARKDHLTQHVRNYHHIETEVSSRTNYSQGIVEKPRFSACCVHEGCSLFRPIDQRTWELDRNPLFASRVDFTKHMRQEHDETPFPCTKAGCKRVNGKGYFRKQALGKHMKREHGISDEPVQAVVADDAVGEDSFMS